MPLRTSDRIATASRATAEQAIAGLRRLVTRVDLIDVDLANELERACNEGGIDLAFAWAHAANECDLFRDTDWTVHLNAWGIGHADNMDRGVEFESPRACARFYVGELLLKLRRPIPASLADARSYAPEKWDDVERIVNGVVGIFPTVERIADLNKRFGPNNREAVWMTDPSGPEAIVDKGRALFPDLPDQSDGGTSPPIVPSGIVFGRVPHPAMQIRDIPSTVNTAWNDLGPRTIRGIVWHRSLGSHNGNDSYFRGEGRNRALTDYGIAVAAQDGQALAGSLYRWNDPEGRRSPWANGPVSEPYGDGKAFVDRYGVAASQRDLTSVEISGFQTTPLDPASRETIAQLTAFWADDYRVSWETFPLIPSEGNRSFVLHHVELTRGTGKLCPFQVVVAETNDLIARARAILMEAQTGATSDPEPGPEPEPTPVLAKLPKGMSTGVAVRLFNPNKIKRPDGGSASFNAKGGISQTWLKRGLSSIPTGDDWTAGRWPSLVSITRRGDDRLIWSFSDGFVIQEGEKAA